MKALVLAAGTGSRLGEITKARTKGMVPVKGKKLIDHLINFLDINFFDEIIVAGGFHYTDLKNHIDSLNIPKIKVIENKDYLKGNIFTLATGLKEFSDDSFLITNVDHIYPPSMFDKMKKSLYAITAMCDFDRNLTADDMKVKLNNESTIEKIDKKLNDWDCGYIGMTYVDSSMSDIYRETVNKTIEEYGDKAVVENVLQLLASENKTDVKICDLSGFGWYECDDEEDLKKAEKGLTENKEKFIRK